MTTAKDKHGREFRAGDLCRWMHYPDLRRLQEAPDGNCLAVAKSIRDVWQQTFGPAAEEYWEVLARGLPTDPVPAQFEPERDAQGRPVLGKDAGDDRLDALAYALGVKLFPIQSVDDAGVMRDWDDLGTNCDGCGAPGATTKGIIRGKPGVACAKCAARAIYPLSPSEHEAAHALASGGGKIDFAKVGSVRGVKEPSALRYRSSEEPMLRCIGCGREPWTAAQRAFLAERKAERWCCGECPDEKSKPLETPPQPVVIAGGVYEVSSGTWDESSLASRYAAFDKRVREIVEKVAPLAPVVTDRVVGNAERADGILVAFKDKLIGEIVFPFTHDDETFAINFEYHLGTYLMAAGKRAMGKR